VKSLKPNSKETAGVKAWIDPIHPSADSPQANICTKVKNRKEAEEKKQRKKQEDGA
jgi:hypothetical protein